MVLVDATLKIYNSMTTIGPLELKIPESGTTALVDPNGAGKFMLLTTIGRLLGMDSGTIEMVDTNVAATKLKDFVKVLSALRQENRFVTRLMVCQLVGSGCFSHSRGRPNVKNIEIAERVISFLHLEETASCLIDELSGGQRQCAYVVMALIQDARYVLPNEPLNNLDIVHFMQMIRCLCRIAKEPGRMIMIALHGTDFAATYTDMIIAMRNGQVAVSGSPEELFCEEALTGIFKASVETTPGPHGPVAVYL